MQSPRLLSRTISAALASTSGGGWLDIPRCNGAARGWAEGGNGARPSPKSDVLVPREVLICFFFEAEVPEPAPFTSRAASRSFVENPWSAIVLPAGHAFFRGRPR